jgi:hypothetical protein
LQKKRGAGAQVHVRGTRARQRRAIRKGSAGDFSFLGPTFCPRLRQSSSAFPLHRGRVGGLELLAIPGA